MIGIQLIRTNPEAVKENLIKKDKNADTSIVDTLASKDKEWRECKKQLDDLRHEKNTLSKRINEIKKEMKEDPSKKEEFQTVIQQAKQVPAKITATEQTVKELEDEITGLQQALPNIMHEEVPEGESDEDNVEVQRWGEPTAKKDDVLPHQEVAVNIQGADFESAATTSGNGFYYLTGDLALLNQALIQLAIQTMKKNGFTYVETPLLLKGDIIRNVTDLHDQENMIYKIEEEDLYLIGTSEHSLIGRYMNTFIEEQQLPVEQTSYSMCFRKEKGSHGLDERGLFRTHQFNKVEMVVICKPEDSMKQYERMKTITVDLFRSLELPVRELAICAGDLGDLKHIQSDIEVWSPRREEYVEVGSCSNLTDAQSQLLNIRVKTPQGTYHPHTLNNTVMATSRALVTILENNQNEDGSVTIPEVLRPYMGGQERIEAAQKK